eukprot:scaffold84933_cov50-Attheya_sp.AAC.1
MPLFGKSKPKRPKSTAATATAATTEPAPQPNAPANGTNMTGSTHSGGSGGTRSSSLNSGGGADNNVVFRVNVPENVSPGEEFSVYAGNRIVRVRCPPDSRPGQSLQITVPAEQSRGGTGPGGSNGPPPPDSPNVTRINDPSAAAGQAAYMVAIPDGMRGGQQFPVSINGQQLM